MIISEQWLRDWVKVDLTAQEIADCLTNAGLEVDAVEAISAPIDKLLVGKVLTVTKHPDADRLNLTTVDVGEQVLDIVCGAANVREGLLVAVAMVGAKLPNGLKIKKAKVRGVESHGMLCSASELGLEEESSGLIELDEDAEVGQRVDEYLQLDDHLIDIDLTPNRGDCLSVQGVARELKVLADGQYHPLDISPVESSLDQQVSIQLEADSLCPSYLGRIVKGVDQAATTPLWMQERLRRSGVRPISAIVDITNYVMLELGQPMHAFDLNKLDGGITVRLATEGEQFTLLDDSSASLTADTLVIADSAGPIAIAGVMGGADSAIGEGTQDIVLEAAHFTRKAVAGTARRYGLHTESSQRFERGVDPLLPAMAIERATELILEICGGQAGLTARQQCESGLPIKPPVKLRLDRLVSLLGMPLEQADVSSILARIADDVAINEGEWSVVPPSYRFDIEREADLVEEVARVKGYDSIPTAMPRIAPRSQTASESSIGTRQVRQSLVARDYREAITYSFIDAKSQSLFDDETPVKLANPLAENMSVMRTSLVPGLMNALQFNVNRQRERVRFFEIGASYHHDGAQYREVQRLAGVLCGPSKPAQWGVSGTQNVDFYDVKSDLQAVLSLTGHTKPIIFELGTRVALHPGQQAKIVRATSGELINGKVAANGAAQDAVEIGWLGRLHPSLEKHYGVSNVFAFELVLDNALDAEKPVFTPISRFPSIKRDLSVIVDEAVAVSALSFAVGQALGKVLTRVDVFDVYRGDGVGDDSKSVSLSFELRHTDRTMTDDEAEKLMGKAHSVLESEFGARLRS
ncbi:phenylalanine--tRNA ligase subunit beta [Arenicella xantha]|uniref:Phenylalanine--tRNA ligase beta subunit n=1 Tax=Arenicella xantha TaxID=644221 RepID=A0A395JLF8_9GAMM|nr:phenylalanine--tRNA ligase subunit beta [Arenicella xantha]RBP51439.1 phenylalanyl-tRNA synthetase beta subunit [Arenicella xantha]